MSAQSSTQSKTVLMLGLALGGAVLSLPKQAEGQGVRPKEDSGWVSLFNGRDFTGLYIREGGVLRNPATQTIFRIQGDSIFSPSGFNALLTTKAVYSRYQMRVKYKYGSTATGQNGGLIYHIESTDFDSTNAFGTANLRVPYFFGRGYVQAIEFQTYVGNAGAYIGIGNHWARTTTTGGRYSPTGTPYIAPPDGGGGGRYINTANTGVPANWSQWVQCQLNAYGSDSVVHIVGGLVAAKAWKLRHVVVTDADGADMYMANTDTANAIPKDRGHIGIQSEGSNIYYRDWDIRMLDAQGRPIIPGCTNPAATNYNPLATQDNGSCLTTALKPLNPRSKNPDHNRRIHVGGLTARGGYLDVKGRTHR
jgi:hypothetical protein